MNKEKMIAVLISILSAAVDAFSMISPRPRASMVLSAERSRRDVVADSALAVAAAAVGILPPIGAAAEEGVQDGRVVSASELLAFSRLPARRIVITGANSGIG